MDEKSEPKPKKATQIVSTLIVVATLLGGTVAFFELRDRFSGGAKPVAQETDNWARHTLNNAVLSVPKEWKKLDLAVVESTTPGFGRFFELFPGSYPKVMYFEFTQPNDDFQTHIRLAHYPDMLLTPTDLERMVKKAEHTVSRVQTPNGEAVRVIRSRDLGSGSQTMTESWDNYVWCRKSGVWSVFLIGEEVHVRAAGETFAKVVNTLKLP